jgi:hypothetical protein
MDAGEGVRLDLIGEEDLGDAIEFDEGGLVGHGVGIFDLRIMTYDMARWQASG